MTRYIIHPLALALALIGFGGCDDPDSGTSAPARGGQGKADVMGTCADSGEANHCGGPATSNCWCDAECVDNGDCCSDVTDVCGIDDGNQQLECNPLDCPEFAPEDARLCPDGTVLERELCAPINGACDWTFPECPEDAEQPTCGLDDCDPFAPSVSMQCPDGSIVEKDVCAPDDGGCAWAFSPCP